MKAENYVDATTSSNAMNAFVGSEERVRIPSSGKHCSLQAFIKHVLKLAEPAIVSPLTGLFCK